MDKLISQYCSIDPKTRQLVPQKNKDVTYKFSSSNEKQSVIKTTFDFAMANKAPYDSTSIPSSFYSDKTLDSAIYQINRAIDKAEYEATSISNLTNNNLVQARIAKAKAEYDESFNAYSSLRNRHNAVMKEMLTHSTEEEKLTRERDSILKTVEKYKLSVEKFDKDLKEELSNVLIRMNDRKADYERICKERKDAFAKYRELTKEHLEKKNELKLEYEKSNTNKLKDTLNSDIERFASAKTNTQKIRAVKIAACREKLGVEPSSIEAYAKKCKAELDQLKSDKKIKEIFLGEQLTFNKVKLSMFQKEIFHSKVNQIEQDINTYQKTRHELMSSISNHFQSKTAMSDTVSKALYNYTCKNTKAPFLKLNYEISNEDAFIKDLNDEILKNIPDAKLYSPLTTDSSPDEIRRAIDLKDAIQADKETELTNFLTSVAKNSEELALKTLIYKADSYQENLNSFNPNNQALEKAMSETHLFMRGSRQYQNFENSVKEAIRDNKIDNIRLVNEKAKEYLEYKKDEKIDDMSNNTKNRVIFAQNICAKTEAILAQNREIEPNVVKRVKLHIDEKELENKEPKRSHSSSNIEKKKDFSL